MINNIKVIEIDGKQVKFKATAATPLRYKEKFGKDYFSEILKMEKLAKLKESENQADILSKIDFDTLYNIIWVLAKTADKNIPDPLDWLDDFATFPIGEILPQLQELIVVSLQGKK